MGRPRLSIEEHVIRGTYRPDRHGPLPPGLEVPADVAERLRAERTAQSRAWRKKHPYRSRAFNRKSYAKRRERKEIVKGTPETRIHGATVSTRRDGSKLYIEGRIPYNSPSEDLGGFVEILAPSVFNRTLSNQTDVKMLWSHDEREVLGSTKAKTLLLESRIDGLYYSCQVPASASGRFETIQRGDMTGCSFGFVAEADTWDHKTTPPTRTLTAARLLELSPCAFPAYPESSAAAAMRSRESAQKAEAAKKAEAERLRLELELLQY